MAVVGIRLNKGEIVVTKYGCGGIRLDKGEIRVTKYGFERDKVE